MRTARRCLFTLLFAALLSMLVPSGFAIAESADGASGAPKADIAFVIDSTGSMGDCISNVTSTVGEFVDELEDSGVDARICVIDFKDITCDGNDSTVIHRTSSFSPWFTSVTDVHEVLDSIEATEGGDTPETDIDALGYIANGDIKFRSDAHKFVFLFTDANYKSANTHGYTSMRQVVDQLVSQGVSISVITDTSYFDDSYSQGDEDDSYVDLAGAPGDAELDPQKAAIDPQDAMGAFFPEQIDVAGAMDTIRAGDTLELSVTSDTTFLSFTPTTTGIYVFESNAEEDTVGGIYNKDGELLTQNDDGGENYNFRIRALMRAGVTYHLGVCRYSGDEAVNVPISLTYVGGTTHVAQDFPSYREITILATGILADIYDDFSDAMRTLAASVLKITMSGGKKAIYVLPGYMGSQLYKKSDGSLVWVDAAFLKDDVTKFTVPFGATSILLRDSDGGDGKVRADLDKDLYGAQDNYKTLMTRLKSEFGDEYDVYFFGYDWLGDLSDEAARLESHIKTHGYKKVTLITHSTGGLLASNFIARSAANRRVVEKAILVAPPLFGTYSALQPIEEGKTATSDQLLKDNGVADWQMGFAHNWVRSVTKNSPTTYQLLPSVEYLRATALIYESDFTGTPVTSISKYYEVLNGSGSINSTLTNGNSRSHEYFRSTVLNGNIIKVLQGVDTVIVGSGSGNSTPAIVKYKDKLLGGTKYDDMIYKKDGDGTVMGFSAFATENNKNFTLLHKNFKGVSHGDLVQKSAPLDYIMSQIGSSSSGASPAGAPVNEDYDYDDAVDLDEIGMAESLKFTIDSDRPISIRVTDAEGNVVDPETCDDPDFVWAPITVDAENSEYRYLVYVPSAGWKVEVFALDQASLYEEIENDGYDPEEFGITAEVPDEPGTLTVELATLDRDGFKTASATYSFVLEGDGSEPTAVFDLSGGVTEGTVGSAEQSVAGDVTTHSDAWDIDEELVFGNVGEAQVLHLTGEDAEAGSITLDGLAFGTSDESVAIVDDNGTVLAVGYGIASISAYDEGSERVETCLVTVRRYAQSISHDDVTITVGERYVPNPTFDSEEVTDTKLEMVSSNPGIVGVEDDVLVGYSVGSATITATVAGGARTTFTVTVESDDVISVENVVVEAASSSLNQGESMAVWATIEPSDATMRGVEWHVSDESVLAIVESTDAGCIVEAIGGGTASVFAVTADGGYSGAVDVLVHKLVKWERLAGKGRYDTMKEIVDKGWSGETGGTVVVAVGTNFKDALAAAGLAGIDEAPVVLTDGKKLSPQARSVLESLHPSTVYVAGGTAAISDSVLKEINKVTGIECERKFGANAAATSAALAMAGQDEWCDNTAIIATNKTFPDALSVAPVSYAMHWPILLASNGKSLSTEVKNALVDLDIEYVYIVGGELAVTPNVVKQLDDLGIEVEARLYGNTSVETSRAIADWAIELGLGADRLAFATPKNYPDALGGAALCGKYGSVLLLATDGRSANLSFAQDHLSTINNGYVFGGTSVFSDSLLESLPKVL